MMSVSLMTDIHKFMSYENLCLCRNTNSLNFTRIEELIYLLILTFILRPDWLQPPRRLLAAGKPVELLALSIASQ